jgi:endonuclease-8
MPEGHTVHRTAIKFNELFAGQLLQVSSPQGRFTAGAKVISGRKLTNSRAIGKQLFLEFDNELTLRIHLGIYGKWSFAEHQGELPDPQGQVRARFHNHSYLADLRGPTVCEVISAAEVAQVEQRLGPDPLNPNPRGRESARFIDRVISRRTPIGLALMNQDVISGIGNVYRAEILFRAGINPHMPGSELSKDQLEEIWHDAVKLMKVGVSTGYMITRNELLKKNPDKAERNFVYKREGLPCRVCGTNVSLEVMAARKLYWCVGCQK